MFKPYGSTSTTLYSFRSASDTHLLDIFSDGHINVGTPPGSGSYKLNVGGSIRANEVVVNTSGADFVFADDYHLRSLNNLAAYIKIHKHLPDIPDAKEIKSNGASVGELQTKLLQKVEELTLYVIQLKEQNDALNNKIVKLQKK